jgi:hypothetical protein
MQQWQPALADFSSALRLDPKLANSLYGRGFAKLKLGDASGGNADMAAATAIEQNIPAKFVRYGLH